MINHLKPILLAIGLHLWQADFSLPAWQWEEAWAMLSSDEKKRAEGYIFPADRERFILRRGLLRLLISFHTGMEPAQVRLGMNRYGKPFLENPPPNQPLYFNLSHSGAVTAYVFSKAGETGVDIEKVDPAYPWEPVSKHFCSNGELEQILSLPENQRQRAFFTLWTCKEAYLKMTGQGLSALEATLQDPWAGFCQRQIIPLELGEDYVGHAVLGQTVRSILQISQA